MSLFTEEAARLLTTDTLDWTIFDRLGISKFAEDDEEEAEKPTFSFRRILALIAAAGGVAGGLYLADHYLNKGEGYAKAKDIISGISNDSGSNAKNNNSNVKNVSKTKSSPITSVNAGLAATGLAAASAMRTESKRNTPERRLQEAALDEAEAKARIAKAKAKSDEGRLQASKEKAVKGKDKVNAKTPLSIADILNRAPAASADPDAPTVPTAQYDPKKLEQAPAASALEAKPADQHISAADVLKAVRERIIADRAARGNKTPPAARATPAGPVVNNKEDTIAELTAQPKAQAAPTTQVIPAAKPASTPAAPRTPEDIAKLLGVPVESFTPEFLRKHNLAFSNDASSPTTQTFLSSPTTPTAQTSLADVARTAAKGDNNTLDKLINVAKGGGKAVGNIAGKAMDVAKGGGKAVGNIAGKAMDVAKGGGKAVGNVAGKAMDVAKGGTKLIGNIADKTVHTPSGRIIGKSLGTGALVGGATELLRQKLFNNRGRFKYVLE